jgi:TrmH family RNA methyltransferase
MIRSAQNETIKTMRRLRSRQGDHALLEGAPAITQALSLGIVLDTVLATPAALTRPEGRALAASLRRAPLEVDPELLDRLGDADSPRGWLAAARLPRRGADTLDPAPEALILYADGVQEPGNLGALARVAEAFGASALALSPGSVHPNHPRALRAAAGSLLRLPVAIGVTVEALDARCAQRPLWIALDAHGGSPPGALPPEAGTAVLAAGSEGHGLSGAVAARADLRWTVPLEPPVESLNVAVAVGIALHALRAASG